MFGVNTADEAAPATVVGHPSPWSVNGWRWGLILALLSIPGLWLEMAAFFPGRANLDIVHQANQALNRIPYDDWHPPIMSAFWSLLERMTGSMGSLLVVQLLGMAVAGWLLARLLGKVSDSRLLSLAGIGFPLLPHVVSQMGVLWKDTQMGVALLVALLLLARVNARHKRTLWWLLPAGLLLVYGADVRKNALAAALPLMVWVAWQVCRAVAPRQSPRPAPRRFVGGGLALVSAVIVLVLAVTLTDKALVALVNVKQTSQISQVYLDDVLFTVPAAELEAHDSPAPFKAHLLQAQAACARQGDIWDAYWNCYGRGVNGKPFAPIADQAELQKLWWDTVPTHPGRYVAYRTQTFGAYLSGSQLVWWEYRWGQDARSVGLWGGDRTADSVLRAWVVDIWQKHFPWVYAAWFWLASGLAALVASRVTFLRARRRDGAVTTSAATPDGSSNDDYPRETVFALAAVAAASGVLYQLAYFPVIPSDHFRYTWWSTLSVTASAMLLGAAAARALIQRRRGAAHRTVAAKAAATATAGTVTAGVNQGEESTQPAASEVSKIV